MGDTEVSNSVIPGADAGRLSTAAKIMFAGTREHVAFLSQHFGFHCSDVKVMLRRVADTGNDKGSITMPRKPRKLRRMHTRHKPKPVQEPIKSFVSLREIKLGSDKWDLDAAARVAYESFLHGAGLKVGQKISDETGVHRISSWANLTSFRRARWRTVAQKVIDAATGTDRKEPA